MEIQILLKEEIETKETEDEGMSQGVYMILWKVLGPGDDNSESISTLKVYCP